MIDWNNKPTEVKCLLNPGFCSLVFFEIVKNFNKKNQKGMPFEIAFVALPMILNRRISNQLPKTTNARMDMWLKNNLQIKYIFMRSALNMRDYAYEALIFGLKHEVIKINEEGRLIEGKLRKKATIVNTKELKVIIKQSQFLGRWLSKIDNTINLYSILGIKP
ncbi:MAG: three component ABC system middle component [Candidatus Paceibacterota bacterium]